MKTEREGERGGKGADVARRIFNRRAGQDRYVYTFMYDRLFGYGCIANANPRPRYIAPEFIIAAGVVNSCVRICRYEHVYAPLKEVFFNRA